MDAKWGRALQRAITENSSAWLVEALTNAFEDYVARAVAAQGERLLQLENELSSLPDTFGKQLAALDGDVQCQVKTAVAEQEVRLVALQTHVSGLQKLEAVRSQKNAPSRRRR